MAAAIQPGERFCGLARHKPTAFAPPSFPVGNGVTDRLLDAREVAEFLNVPVSWVRESTRSGAMPHVQLRRYRRYRGSAVLAWLEECSRPGRPVALRSRP
jgi:excisionase family DNA binding protein